jgi:hypothetical protein
MPSSLEAPGHHHRFPHLKGHSVDGGNSIGFTTVQKYSLAHDFMRVVKQGLNIMESVFGQSKKILK